MQPTKMRKFWDARAREDPYFFVDNRLRYGDPDLDRFWAGGPEALSIMEAALGARILPSHEIVEVGCGVGRMTRALCARGHSVRALDISPEMIERARELNSDIPNAEFILGDGGSLRPIADDSADVIHSDVVFQHIPDPAITLGYVREMGRVLRAGGFAMFQVSNSPEVHRQPRLFQRTRHRIRNLAARGPGGQTHPAWLGSSVELDALRRTANEVGLELNRSVGEGTISCQVLMTRR